jgi:hypothetical protein
VSKPVTHFTLDGKEPACHNLGRNPRLTTEFVSVTCSNCLAYPPRKNKYQAIQLATWGSREALRVMSTMDAGYILEQAREQVARDEQCLDRSRQDLALLEDAFEKSKSIGTLAEIFSREADEKDQEKKP